VVRYAFPVRLFHSLVEDRASSAASPYRQCTRPTRAPRRLQQNQRQYLSTLPERDQAIINFRSTNVNNPFFGIPQFAGTGLSGRTLARSQLLRPYPQFTQINTTTPAGYSYYHALQVQVKKRFSNELTFQAAYTYSRFMEAIGYLDPTNPFLQRVVSDQDYPQRFIVTGVYELPVGRGQHFGAHLGRGWDALFGGWQFEAWYEGQAEAQLAFGNAIFRGNLRDIPLPLDQRRAEEWFNVNAFFERNSANALASNIRTFTTRFTGVRANGINNLDASVFKTFQITERVKAQFRTEAFTALNHVQFADPDTNPYSTTFGQISGERGHGQKMITFVLKLLY
jgi:hypothetical protein